MEDFELLDIVKVNGVEKLALTFMLDVIQFRADMPPPQVPQLSGSLWKSSRMPSVLWVW